MEKLPESIFLKDILFTAKRIILSIIQRNIVLSSHTDAATDISEQIFVMFIVHRNKGSYIPISLKKAFYCVTE